MPRRPLPEQIEFTADATGAALAALDELVAAGRGWLNLFPEVEEDLARAVTPSVVGALFRTPGPPIPQATFLPATESRRGRVPPQLGMTHGVGAMIVRRLAEKGLPLPEGWTVVQDHVRRGLVLRLDDPPDTMVVLGWALKAAEELCPIPVTGGWLAEVHRP